MAVQSHWFSVGSIVPWAEACVGAVATQSFAEPSYGLLGLALMRAGKSAEEALKALLSVDPNSKYRQVAMVDSAGRVAVHTGELCIPEAGHVAGEGFSVQANLMRSAEVWPAMAEAFESSEGPLKARLLAALEAAEAVGGDIRGQAIRRHTRRLRPAHRTALEGCRSGPKGRGPSLACRGAQEAA